MQNKPLHRALYITFFTLIVLSFSFMFLALTKRHIDNSFDDKTILDWSDGWVIQVDSATPIEADLPIKLSSEYNAVVTASKSLPEKLSKYNCMMLESKRQEIYVYVNDELRGIYTDNGQKIGNSLPSSYLMVPLYNTDAGSTVRAEFVSDTYYSGNINRVYIGSEMSLILMLIKSNVMWIVMIGVIGVIGLVCLTCFIMYRSTFDASIQFLHLFLFSLFTVVWCFSQIKVRQVFIKDLSVCESIGHCCFMLIPFAIALISNYFSDNRHPVYHQFCIIVSTINFLVQNIIHTGFGVDYFELQVVTQLFLFWMLTTCIGGSVVDAVKGRLEQRRLVIVGFIGLNAGIIIEAVLTGIGVRYTQLSFYIMGSVVFITSFSLNTFFDLRKVQKEKNEAEEASKAKSLFLATMSHEIRTPINVVLGMNEMILRECEDRTIREYSGNIAEAGKSLLSLVNDILDFSKIESGKMDIVCVEYYMKTLLGDLEMMTKSRIGNNDIKLILDIDESIPSKYYGDEVRIKEVLTNILTNAVKYTESGTITLTVKKTERIGEDICLGFSVKDTGMGIKPENIETLMSSSFIRFDEQKNRNIEGTGLGISITRQLLTLMGSELKIDSVYGEGSDFHFVLKQRVVDETPIGCIEEKPDRQKPVRKNSFTAKDAYILSVDDTKTNLMVVKGLLKPYEMTVDTAVSGSECIAKCRERQYDIILMDHMMPGMDGIDTLKALREEKLITEETKVVALTANAISGAEELYMSSGFDGYLTKPIDVVMLDTCIRQNLASEKIVDIAE